MKKLITLLLATTGLAFAGLASADGLGAGIVGSPHDFADDLVAGTATPGFEIGATGWNFREEICRVCHVPHDHNRATQRYLNGLLWNHEVSTASYTMYDSSWSSTLDGSQSAQPDGIAKLCLGCHDGTVAIDNFDKNTSGTVFVGDYEEDFQHPGAAIPLDGTNLDLRGTHPLSIVYDTAADSNLHPTSNTIGTSGPIADVLDNGKVQCSSCHDVHDQESVPGTHLLRVANTVADGGTASGLCLTCHIK